MRGLKVALSVFALLMSAQANPPVADIQRSLIGSWVGTLEYRDYSEPVTSTQRVKLPTWLTIEGENDALRFRYVYDDGPLKTVSEQELIRIDPATAGYQVLSEDHKVKESYAVAGLASLREGRGALTLSGPGTENDTPVDVRTNIRIGRNILEIVRETATQGQPFVFRHAYVLVRAAVPGK